MYGEGLDGPPMGGYSRAPSFTPDYGLHPHSTHQRLSSAYSPSISPSALPAMEDASQSRSASPHMSQFNFLPHSQTEAYNGSYPASEVSMSTLETTAPPNMSRFNLPPFPSTHTGSTSTSHRTVCFYILLCRTHYLTYSRTCLSSPQLRPPSGQAGRLSYRNRSANFKKN
jgi:hypothetical protein